MPSGKRGVRLGSRRGLARVLGHLTSMAGDVMSRRDRYLAPRPDSRSLTAWGRPPDDSESQMMRIVSDGIEIAYDDSGGIERDAVGTPPRVGERSLDVGPHHSGAYQPVPSAGL